MDDTEIADIIGSILGCYKIPQKLNGYAYLTTAIRFYAQNSMGGNIQIKVINSRVAKEFAVTSANVERSMRNALLHAIKDGGFTNSPPHLPVFNDKVTSLSFIRRIAEYIVDKSYEN